MVGGPLHSTRPEPPGHLLSMWRSLAITDRLALNPLLADESFSAPFELDPAFEPEREREAGFRWGAGPEQLEDMLAATAAAVKATATATTTATATATARL